MKKYIIIAILFALAINVSAQRRPITFDREVILEDSITLNSETIGQWSDIPGTGDVSKSDSLTTFATPTQLGDTATSVITTSSAYTDQEIINFNDTLTRIFLSYTTPETFGAVGDGVTNDSAALQDMFTYAMVNNKNIALGNDKIYACSGELTYNSNVRIDGNNSTILFTYDGIQDVSNYFWGLQMYGSLGTYYSMTSDVFPNTNIAYISDANILNNIEVGSLIKIHTDKNYYSAGRPQGEINKVFHINDTIVYFSQNWHDTYLVSDNAEISIINPVNISIQNLTIQGNGIDFGVGMDIRYAESPYIRNCKFYNNNYASTYNMDVYHADYIYESYNSYQNSAGYGVAFLGACMAPKTSIISENCRHPQVSDGISDGGVTWDAIYYNWIAKGFFDNSAYNVHENTGTGTQFINCTAYLGLQVEDTALYRGNYSADSTYILNEIVNYEGALYESMNASNIGHAIDTVHLTYWDLYNNNIYGFYVASNDLTIKNCRIIGNSYGAINISRTFVDGLKVDGLYTENSKHAVRMVTAAKLSNSSFNNITLKNNIYKLDKNMFQFIHDTLENVTFDNCHSINAQGIYVSDHYGDEINIGTISATGKFLEVGTQSASYPLSILINKANLSMINAINGGITIGTGANVKLFKINDLHIRNAGNSMISVKDDIENFILGNVTLEAGIVDPSYFISMNSLGNIKNLVVNSLTSDSTSQRVYFCLNSGGHIGRASVGLISGYVGGLGQLFSGTFPDYEILSGTVYYPTSSRGSGTPEGVLSAGVGSVYYDRAGGAGTTLYIKESLTGNTGWVAK